MRAAFVGLGVMGGPMASHLARAGHEVRGFNRSPAKAEAWAQASGGTAAESIAAAVAGADLVFACVGDDRDLAEVFAAALPAMALGAVFVDHTTASAALARRCALDAASAGKVFLDAPVSGGQAGAEAGRLSAMVGGDAAALARAEPALRAYCASITHIGPSGAGQLAKMVNQICIAGVLAGLSEGLAFAETAGLDLTAVKAAIGKGAAQSWQMDNRWDTMAAGRFDSGFAVDWVRKDLAIALGEARANGAALPVTALVDQFYADVQAMGGGRLDASSLVRRLRRG